MKFSIRIAAFVVAVFLFASIGFFYLAYNMLDKSVKLILDDSLKNENQQVVSMIKVAGETSVAQHLRTLSDQNLEMVRFYYKAYLAGKMTEAEAKQHVFEVLGKQTVGKTGHIFIVNSLGSMVFYPDQRFNGAELSKYEFIQQQVKKKTGLIHYRWKNPGDSVEREKVLYMSYFDKWDWIISTSAYKSEFDGLISISDFENEITSAVIGKTGYVSVINSKGDFILHPFYQGKNVETLDQNAQSVIRQIIAEKNGTISYKWKNTWENQARSKKAIFTYLEDYDWYVISTYYEDEFYGPFKNLMNIFLATVFSGAVVMVVLIISMVKHQSKPLEKLVEALREGVAGNLSVRLNNQGDWKDEFSELTMCFNGFMDKLESTKESLENEVYIRKQNETRLQSLTETTSEAYIQMTAGSYITAVNKPLCRILNLASDEILGKALNEVFQESAWQAFENHMLTVAQGQPVRFEMCMSDLSETEGLEKHFMVSASPLLNGEGVVAGSFALLTDITELRQVLQDRERLLEKYKELNSNLESKIEERTQEMVAYIETLKATRAELLQSEKLSSLGLMISGIANELNSPLGNGITMSSFIEAQSKQVELKYEQGQWTPEECREYIQNVKAASSMILDNLTKASVVLNSLKHIYPEQIKGMKEAFKLSEAIYQVQDVFKKELRMGAHKFEVACDDEITLFSYPKLIKQLLLNLTSNSILHAFKNGDPGRIVVRVTETPEEIWIEYSDDGSGMPYAVREKMFEPFLKTDEGSSNLGLGLYTVYNIVTLSLRGQIEWNSIEGMGVRFIIKLPMALRQK